MVAGAVEFHHEAKRGAIEVGEVAKDGRLAAELVAETLAAESSPEQGFGFGRVIAEASCVGHALPVGHAITESGFHGEPGWL